MSKPVGSSLDAFLEDLGELSEADAAQRKAYERGRQAGLTEAANLAQTQAHDLVKALHARAAGPDLTAQERRWAEEFANEGIKVVSNTVPTDPIRAYKAGHAQGYESGYTAALSQALADLREHGHHIACLIVSGLHRRRKSKG